MSRLRPGLASITTPQLDILVFGLNFAPEPTGTGRYTGETAAWLARRGHRVTAIVGLPHYPQWRVYQGYSRAGVLRENLEGVDVWRVPHFVPPVTRLTGASRLRMDLHFGLSAARYWIPRLFAAGRPDVVMAVAPPLIVGFYPILYRLRGVPWLLHLQDLQVDVALQLGMLRNVLMRKMLPSIEGFILRRATAVSTITEAMRRRVISKGARPDRVFVFPNWADIDMVRPAARENSFRAELGIGPDHILVMYAGAFGVKHGLDVLVEAAAHLVGEEKLHIVLIGHGADRARVEELAYRLRLRNVQFLDVQPAERLPEVLAAADIHLVLQKRRAADLVMPSKLGNILASGRPCIATADPGTALHDLVGGCNLGLVCPPEDPAALASAILRLASDPGLRLTLGQRARSYAEENLGKEIILKDFEERLAALARRTDAPRADTGRTTKKDRS